MITQTHLCSGSRAHKPLAWVAQFLLTTFICLPFLVSGFSKLFNPAAAALEVAGLDLPYPALLAWMTIAVQLLGSFAVVFGSRSMAISGSLALACFTVFATVLAHAFWNAAPVLRQEQTNAFIEHLSIISALLLLAYLKWRDGADNNLI